MKLKKKNKKKSKTPPDLKDPICRFYVSLFRQKPTSEMAIKWLCENGLGHIVLDLKSLTVTKEKKTI